MSVTVRSLASGSSGNALLIRANDAALLVDCGLSPRVLRLALQAEGLEPSDLSAVCLSHEHGDHARGLPFFKDQRVPIFATRGTEQAVAAHKRSFVHLPGGGTDGFGEVSITAVGVSHDAAEPCGFVISIQGSTIAVFTDLGRVDDQLRSSVRDADLLVIEANHDRELLRHGPYPPHLKRRVASDQGHLANQTCADFLGDTLSISNRTPTVWLAHLSETNNRPILATDTISRSLIKAKLLTTVVALPRRRPGPIWRSDRRPVAMMQAAFSFADAAFDAPESMRTTT